MNKNARCAITWFVTFILAATLAACGGGTANGQCNVLDPSRNVNLPNCPTSTGSGTSVAVPTLKLSLTDAAGTIITTVTTQRAGVLRAVLTDATGTPASGIAVIFNTSDKTASLVPASGSALTDSAGIARIGVAAGTQAGAFTVTANAAVGGTNVTAALDYVVSFPTLSLSPLMIGPSPLSAGGTASLTTTVMEGTQPFMPAQTVSFTSPCAAAGKATISSPVTTVAGVASTSYIDKGCGAPDMITASTSMGGAVVAQTGNLTVLGAIAGQLAFVSALPQNISIKGTGGPGRQESSTVTFKVLDKNGHPVAGAAVDFLIFGGASNDTGTGGLRLSPTTSTSGADGTVSTTLFAGIVNTPVRVTATVTGSIPAVTSTSDQLVISTGIPDQNSFTLSTSTFNVEGASFNGCAGNVGATITATLGDHFNNPVPDGTAVSFTTEGGIIDASCLTGLVNTQLTNGSVIVQKGIPGSCSVRFCAASPRASDERVTILAYALGEESFIDDPTIKNGINRFDSIAETFQDLCEPVRYDRAITDAQANPTWTFPNLTESGWNLSKVTCPLPALGEPYIDTNGDGEFNFAGDHLYNGVLKFDPATGQTVANSKVPAIHVRQSLVEVMSGSTAVFTPISASSPAVCHCTDGIPFNNVVLPFTVAIRDNNATVFPPNTLAGNILPAGTRIEFSASNATIVGNSTFIVPNTNDPQSSWWTYTVQLQSIVTQTSAATGLLCSSNVGGGLLTVKVTTPQNVITGTSFSVTN